MSELNLTLPPREAKRPPLPRGFLFLSILWLSMGATILVSLWHPLFPSKTMSGLTLDQRKDLALKMETQGLHESAVQMWQEYLAEGTMGEEEKAKIWYRIGKICQEAGLFERALSAFYRSEEFFESEELSSELANRTQRCLEALGKFSALRYELADRVTLGTPGKQEGDEVLAEIGAQKITRRELDRKIEERIELQMKQLYGFLPAEERNRQKESLLKELLTPQGRKRFLQQIVFEEILYRRARELKLSDEAQVRELLLGAEKSILAQQVLEKNLVQKVNITTGDLQTFYEANRSRYRDAEKARIAHILVEDEKTAQAILERAKAGEKFADLAASFSMDSLTKGKGGEIEEWVEKGLFVPGIGNSEEATVIVFSTRAGELASKIVKSEKGYHVVFVRERIPERLKTFEEVKNQVFQELSRRKQQEVQQTLLEELQERYRVSVHDSRLSGTKPDPQKTDEKR